MARFTVILTCVLPDSQLYFKMDSSTARWPAVLFLLVEDPQWHLRHTSKKACQVISWIMWTACRYSFDYFRYTYSPHTVIVWCKSDLQMAEYLIHWSTDYLSIWPLFKAGHNAHVSDTNQVDWFCLDITAPGWLRRPKVLLKLTMSFWIIPSVSPNSHKQKQTQE